MRILLVFCLVASLAVGASLPTAAPEQAGFSSDRLNRINTLMQEHITAGRLNGASGLIARNGKVIFRETWGTYKPDTIVRMYSMTKAITGVAAMILYEEGKFSLHRSSIEVSSRVHEDERGSGIV
jgi:CubicO group peptidase (beta-lactamase class C family)